MQKKLLITSLLVLGFMVSSNLDVKAASPMESTHASQMVKSLTSKLNVLMAKLTSFTIEEPTPEVVDSSITAAPVVYAEEEEVIIEPTNPCPYGHENCLGNHSECALGHIDCTIDHSNCPQGHENCDGTHQQNGSGHGAGRHHGTGTGRGYHQGNGNCYRQ